MNQDPSAPQIPNGDPGNQPNTGPQNPGVPPQAPFQPPVSPYAQGAQAGASYAQPANGGVPYPPVQGAGYYANGHIEQRSAIVAGILGILLGVFGAHNFYIGRTSVGVAQLLITVLSFGILSFVSALWGLVEGILFLVSDDPKWRYDARGILLKR
ncbi:NINE protein [Gleimia sp. 6138-11-ORH1]|uniref:TM2 domain-containing protein n=1 Tax=Gleimia sp. 6138-11-ORH1 TaxID=2973937 RepID=UPI002167823A|nr:TM2 domain-containing protein [Gleimia sp. 6138-11-ORH1]MCS4483907.1 NINE protein [Gleimia sp. 6138-11-ORH1]